MPMGTSWSPASSRCWEKPQNKKSAPKKPSPQLHPYQPESRVDLMTSQGEEGGTQLKPPAEAVRSHYDKSNEFFKLWLDPSMTYSCGYFDENPDPQHLTKTLEEAQDAKRK